MTARDALRAALLCFAVILIAAGCASLLEPRTLPPECRDEALLALSTEYTAALVSACQGHKLENCDARAAVTRRYAPRFREWEKCHE